MNEQQINAAIAELCGWKCDATNKHEAVMCWVRPGNSDWQTECIPDYCNDLNAMHAACESIHIGKIDLLEHYLGEITLTEGLAMRRSFVGERYKLFMSTARQRAEAFLRAHGKWVEE